MDLKTRLEQLRPRNGAQAVPMQSGSLGARLSRLQIRKKACNPDCPPMTEGELADRLGGRLLEKGVLLIEQRVSLSDIHGDFALETIRQEPLVLPGTQDIGADQLLFMDTETTGLSGGSGTLVFLLGVGRLEGRELVVRQYLLTSFSGEAPLLTSAGDWLRENETLVSYNGKSFDVPLLATRGRMAGVPDPFSKMPHLDLLHPLRRGFRERWPSCRLANAERNLIGFHRQNDLPGAEAPAAWFEWVRHREWRRLSGVLEHNRLDLISLVALLPLLCRAYREPWRWEADIGAVARSWLKAGRPDIALKMLERGRAGLSHRGLMELARLWRNLGEWQRACEVWWLLSNAGNDAATEQLAKYHEHVIRDIETALWLSGRLVESEGSRRRCRRLTGKLSSNQM